MELEEQSANLSLYMDYDDKNNMDEFYWEREFRKDDSRINSCMREIPAVVDLPGEDELLMKRVQKQPEYAKGLQKWNESFLEEFFEFDDISFPDNWKECEGAAIYSTLEGMMEEWCRLYASENSEAGLKVLCYYGNIMGFAIDLVDFGGDKMAGLKVALCKRIYNGLSNIISTISAMKSDNTRIFEHKDRLFKLRQEVLDLRFKLKQSEG